MSIAEARDKIILYSKRRYFSQINPDATKKEISEIIENLKELDRPGSIRLELFNSKDFLDELKKNEIDYKMNYPKPGVIYMTGESAEIIIKLGASFISLAAIVVKWLKVTASRKVIIQTKNKKVIHIEGYSEKDVEKILKHAEKITVIDSKPNKSP